MAAETQVFGEEVGQEFPELDAERQRDTAKLKGDTDTERAPVPSRTLTVRHRVGRLIGGK